MECVKVIVMRTSNENVTSRVITFVGDDHYYWDGRITLAYLVSFFLPQVWSQKAPVYLIRSVHAMNWAKMEDNASMVALGFQTKKSPGRLGGW